jgi:virginiamycin B lyase
MDARLARNAWSMGLALAASLTLATTARAQIIDQIETDTPNSGPSFVTTAPDGTLWFVETTGNRIGAVNPYRTDVVEVSLKIAGSQPTAIAIDGSGRAWFTESGTNRIGVYTPATGALVEYYWGGSNLGLAGISVDGQGRVFFTESRTNRIGMIDPGRLTLQYFSWATGDLGLLSIACDSTGRAWFTENRANRVGVVDPYWNYVYDYYYTGGLGPYGITVDADNDVWFTEQASGTISMLDTTDGSLFQFDGINGVNSQPRYIDTWQNNQQQTVVAWAEPAPGNSLVGLLNADTGAKSQIQASTPFALPMGVTFAPDNSLWWTEYNTSQLAGSYYSGTLVRRSAPREDRMATLALLTPPSLPTRFAPAVQRIEADRQVILVRKETKAKGKGREQKARIEKIKAKTEQLALRTEGYQPEKKARKTKKGRGNSSSNGRGRGGA